MMSKKEQDTVVLVDEFRQHALEFGQRVRRHGDRLQEDLRSKLTKTSGEITNDTSPNLKARIDIPGGLFSKNKRPTPLGQD